MERELLLLGLLRRSDMHGYQLHEFINNNLASCTDLKKPTAYHLLDKLEKQGWIAGSVVDDPDSSRPNRRIYHLTSAGETAFQRLLRENLASFMPATFGGNIGLAFLDEIPQSEALDLLHERRMALQAALDGMAQIPPHGGSMALVIAHQAHHLRSELDWLDHVITHYLHQEQQGE